MKNVLGMDKLAFEDSDADGVVHNIVSEKDLGSDEIMATYVFTYNDKGSMAIIGRNKAVAELAAPKLHFIGFIAWLMWLFVHLISLIHFRNKIKTCFSWISAYASKDQYLRMIIKPASKDS